MHEGSRGASRCALDPRRRREVLRRTTMSRGWLLALALLPSGCGSLAADATGAGHDGGQDSSEPAVKCARGREADAGGLAGAAVLQRPRGEQDERLLVQRCRVGQIYPRVACSPVDPGSSPPSRCRSSSRASNECSMRRPRPSPSPSRRCTRASLRDSLQRPLALARSRDPLRDSRTDRCWDRQRSMIARRACGQLRTLVSEPCRDLAP